MTTSSRGHDDIMMSSSRQHNNINNNIYNKKTNTIVLAKKEIDESFDQNTDQVLELVSEQSEISSENQPPIHEQKNVLKKTKQSQAHRGGRLPKDFEPDFDFAIQEGLPPERVKIEIAKFRDYWSSKSGANATKLDWQATWRNWVRNAKDFNKPSQGVNYGRQGNEPIHWSRRVVHEMSNLKNADSIYSFLFKDDERISTPLAAQSETLTFRSGEDYISSQ
ncbi:hypothetical protein [Bartonella rattaustraliani]|uniref:hypothetical protein n=1 Tax=Bartonella rattaustraliani TaxID=481139 RepID=UPI0003661DDB|nr:hypothetical protein [Bartonella rattaustraliani]